MDYITLALAKDYTDQVAASGGSGSVDLKDYYKKSEVDNKLDEKVNNADVYTKSEIDGKISSIYKYQGSVANKESLPTENLTVGDVYNLEDTGMNVAYTGEGWDDLGSSVDLTSYYTKTEVDNLPLIKRLIYGERLNNLKMGTSNVYENSAVALGSSTTANGYGAFSEGIQTTASAAGAHAEGNSTKASGMYSHAEGDSTKASGTYSHAEGYNTKASGMNSHAEGYSCEAPGHYSHAEGHYTKASSDNQHAQGKYNIADTSDTYAHIIGNGTGNSTRSNAHTIDWEGNAWFSGDIYTGSTSGTNKDEGSIRLAKITELDTKVDKVENKGLSTNDFTNDLKTKLTGIENNAEVNKIDIVKINGQAAEIVDKAIDITIPGSKEYTYQPLMHNLPAIEVVNGEYGFTQENNTFSVEALSASSEHCTTYINITQENIANMILNISIMPKDINDSFLETNCTLSIYKNNTSIFQSSKVGFQYFGVPVNKGDQLMLDWSRDGYFPPRDAIFSVAISNYITNEINTTELEEVMYSETDNQYEYTNKQITNLANTIFTIRNKILPDVYIDEYQYSNREINIPLSKNREYRISLASNNNSSQVINVAFVDGDNLNTNKARYQTKLILKTSYKRNITYTFNLMNGGEVPLSGDDVTNNVFTPQRLKVYEITFTFNGFMIYGEIKSFSYPEPAE